jgi:hypothetical protein
MKLALIATTTASAFVSAVNGGAVNLTPSNFDSEMADKNAFVKFLAPW